MWDNSLVSMIPIVIGALLIIIIILIHEHIQPKTKKEEG